MTHEAMRHIPLAEAYLCADCNSIGNNSTRCPACAGLSLISLSAILNREESPDDREATVCDL